MSTTMTVVYINTISLYTQNDYFWSNFNTTGAQSFMSDVYNAQLWDASTRELPLFSNEFATEKDYSKDTTKITMQDTKARRVVLEYLNNIPAVISSLRIQNAATSMKYHLSYCWLDYMKEWEVAHTAKRQKRCKVRYARNGAVYLESMLRNMDWATWYSIWGIQFEHSYGDAIRQTAGGVAWIRQTTTALASTSLEEEVQYWLKNSITEYRQAWQNNRIGGFDDSVMVETSLNQFSMPLSHIVYSSRGPLWTTAYASVGIWNDLLYSDDVNASLIRNATNSFTLLPQSQDPEMWCGGYPDTPWSVLLHDQVGALSSIDLFIVLPPASFLQVYNQLYKNLLSTLQANAKIGEMYINIPTTKFDMNPPLWKQGVYEFYGGNLFCYEAVARTYVQQSFGFDDACAEPHPPLTIDGAKINILLAMMFQGLKTGYSASQIADICALNIKVQNECKVTLSALSNLYTEWLGSREFVAPEASVLARSKEDVQERQIGIVQYASSNNTPTLLHQLMIDPNDMNWSFYGWLHMIDWVQGIREVISFDGDENTYVTITKQYPPQQFVVDPLQTPTRFSFVLRMLIWYTYILIFFVMVLAFVCGLFSDGTFRGRNLFCMNRIVGLVWIGRPLLIVRGVLAITILSTAKIDLVLDRGFTKLQFSRRTFVETLIMSGETLWLTYSLCDIISITTTRNSWYAATTSSAVVWLITGLLETVNPFIPQAIYKRECVSLNMDFQLTCTSGKVKIGSYDRLLVLSLIQIFSLLIYWIAALRHAPDTSKVPVIIPAIASYMLERGVNCVQYYDTVSSVFCGLISCQAISNEYVFSVLLWVFMPLRNRFSIEPREMFIAPKISMTDQRSALLRIGPNQVQVSRQDVPVTSLRRSFFAKVGLVYLISSAVSSATFIYVTSSKLTNDFLWEGFNSTGMQAFLIDWYNNELNFRPSKEYLDLNNSTQPSFYNTTMTSVSASLLYANTIQFEELGVRAVIEGLRGSDSCKFPWIASQYCYLDFGRKWEIASTQKRQDRCKAMMNNGAVYLEALLRNTDFRKFKSCWGDGIEIGYFNELRQSSAGLQWVEIVETVPMLSVEEEVSRWLSRGITEYEVQWKNYKRLGMIESLMIENALGNTYALTLKASNGTFQFNLQTSLKMYWGLGSDLWAVTQNDTYMGSKSLIRTSSNFAFLNHSIENVIAQNQTITYPLDPGLFLVRKAIGPFGNVDMIHVPCPQSLVLLYKMFIQQDLLILKSNPEAQAPVTLSAQSMHPAPARWQQNYQKSVGGNILCPALSGGLELSYGQFTWCSVLSACGSNVWEFFYVQRQRTMMALIAWGAFEPCKDFRSCISLEDVCKNITRPSTMCITSLTKVQAWTKKFVAKEVLQSLFLEAEKTRVEVQALGIEISQFLKLNKSAPVELLRVNIFDPVDPYFQVISWHLMWEWVLGMREVISFQGDLGEKMNAITSLSFYYKAVPNPLEIPSNLVYYCKLSIQYTTSVIFAVTFITIIYAVVNRGHIEGLNMLEINRVGGIVWVGRPLLCLRSLVAICLLSTSSVHLSITGRFTQITIPTPTVTESISTVLAGSEACWLVIVLSDLCMAITKDYTNSYTMKSTILVAIGSISLSILSPVQPTFRLDRTCKIDEIDMQLGCIAGVVQIGQLNRMVQLVVMTIVVLCLCFSLERWRRPEFTLPQHNASLLLPAGAIYLFHKGPWIYNSLLYLDKSSAFMCGLISFSYNRKIYLLDVKTWRAHIITLDESIRPKLHTMDKYEQQNITLAIPIVS